MAGERLTIPAIPTIKSVLGHDFGDEISAPEEIAIYLQALAAAAPDRTRLVEYARTWEGRPLHVLAIASPARIAPARPDQGRPQAARRSRARCRAPTQSRLLGELPGGHLADARRPRQRDLVVGRRAGRGLPPAGRPRRRDGRHDPSRVDRPDRPARESRMAGLAFLFQNKLGRAATPDGERLSAEHDEPWPGGRSNHYLFDMNRDWFAQTQPETRGRLKVALDYFPHVVVDLHEMSGDSSYYFAPPADPLNPFITPDQIRWLETFGRANAARFDDRGFAYFIREVYDSFYPGYGESWPIFNGAIGMTYEQASARGLVFTRDDDTTLTYRQGVVHHFNAAITTAYTAAGNRERLLRDFLEYRRSAIAEGEQGRRARVRPAAGQRSGHGRPAGAESRRPGHRRAHGHRGVQGRHARRAGRRVSRLGGPAVGPPRAQPARHARAAARGLREGTGSPAQEAARRSDLRRHRLEPAGALRRRGPHQRAGADAASTPVRAAPAPRRQRPCRRPRWPTSCRGAATTPGAVNALLARWRARAPGQPQPHDRRDDLSRRAPRSSAWRNWPPASARRWPASSRGTALPVVAARQRLGRSRHLAWLRRRRRAEGAARGAGLGRADLEPVGGLDALRARAALRVHGQRGSRVVARTARPRQGRRARAAARLVRPPRSTTTRCGGCASGCAAAARW